MDEKAEICGIETSHETVKLILFCCHKHPIQWAMSGDEMGLTPFLIKEKYQNEEGKKNIRQQNDVDVDNVDAVCT